MSKGLIRHKRRVNDALGSSTEIVGPRKLSVQQRATGFNTATAMIRQTQDSPEPRTYAGWLNQLCPPLKVGEISDLPGCG